MSVKLLKDTVLGNLTFSKFEGLLLSNLTFNRLHYVTQNSMAFRVFPSNKNSRFSHSVGVMHLSSMMFKYGILNAEDIIMSDYLDEKNNIIVKVLNESIEACGLNSDKIKTELYKSDTSEKRYEPKSIDYKKVLTYFESFCGKSFIKHMSFYSVVFECYESIFTYLILLSSLRVCGLLHDIGHLPFSHLTEYVLEDLLSYLKDNQDNSDSEKDILKVFDKLTEDNIRIHETIGTKLTEIVFHQIESEIKENSKEEREEAFNVLFCKMIQTIVSEISKNENGELSCLHSIVSSDFDADRLDFVVRDGFSSGLIDKTGDFQRILLMYCLGVDDGKYRFMPAIQSQNDLQEVVKDRYRIYRYLVNHHKVKKMDYLLQRSLFISIKEEICSGKKFNDGIELNQLVDTIGVIGKIIDAEPYSAGIEKVCYQFSQINDNWALTLLNRRYSNILSTFKSDTINKDDRLLEKSMTEIFRGTKVFDSLWKRDHEYHEFLKYLSEYIQSANKMDEINEIIEENKKKFNIKSDKSFIECASELIRYLDRVVVNWRSVVEEKFFELDHFVLLVKPKLRTGIKDLKLINLKEQNIIYDFSCISETYNYLEADLARSLQFYVYYINNSQDAKMRIKDMIIDFIIEIIDREKNKKEMSFNV